jgi:hypothetical protein
MKLPQLRNPHDKNRSIYYRAMKFIASNSCHYLIFFLILNVKIVKITHSI